MKRKWKTKVCVHRESEFCLFSKQISCSLTVQVLDDTSAVLIPAQWATENDSPADSSDEDDKDIQMTEVVPEVVPVAVTGAKETKKNKKKKKKKKNNANAKGTILGRFLHETFNLFGVYCVEWMILALNSKLMTWIRVSFVW